MNRGCTLGADVSSAMDTGNGAKPVKPEADRTTLLYRRLRRGLLHVVARQFTLLCVVAVTIAGWIGRRRRTTDGEGSEIMITGRFDSDNWILAHLGPLSASKGCSRLWMVSTNPVPVLPKVVAIYPSKWLSKAVGVTPSRLLTFCWAAVRRRPHIVGGFHVMPNGIASVMVARLVGARSMYFCVGGPAEARDGGIHSADSLFVKMETADPVVERRLLQIVGKSDTIITMGTGAVQFLRGKGIDTEVHVVSGGIDPQGFPPTNAAPRYDLVFVGRLAKVKRIDVLLRAIKIAAGALPHVKAVIVGDGELRDTLRSLAVDLGLDQNVDFVGHQNNVHEWLRCAKVFVLTSDSEGLSLAMMEAMMCGLPAVVSDVGDLADLVENGVNGYLVPRRSPELFAQRFVELLSGVGKLQTFSQAAHRSALRYATGATIQRWDNILAGPQKS